MIFRKLQLSPWAVGLLCVVLCMARAQAPDGVDSTRDTLVYKDGDRVRGHLVEVKGDVLIFKSDRFGELRVASADAVVIKAEQPAATTAVAKTAEAAGTRPSPSTTPEERTEQEKEQEKLSLWDRFSPAVLTAQVREFFGPWHGRLGFSNEIVTDTSHRNNLSLEGKLSRKFRRDAVDLSARYDYDQTDGAPTTDMFKSVNSWRHDFGRYEFSQYRPTVEWNRANANKAGLPSEYVLLQQEFGVGFNLITKPTKTFRLGISENLFDLWALDSTADHTSRALVSLFDEAEWQLPWRMTLTQRGVWYPESRQMHGFEDQIELNKKLTETLSVALRHEIRRNNPDGASPNYTRLRLLLGLDF